MAQEEPAPKKRILVVCQHFWPENFRINDICDYLVERDVEVDVLCGIPNYPKGQFFEGYSYTKNRKQVRNGVNIRRSFEIPRGDNSNFRIFVNYLSYPLSSLFHVPRLFFSKRKYDKIFIYQLSPVMMSIAGIALGKLKKIETTIYVMDLWPENLFSVLDMRPSFKNLARRVSHWHYKKIDKIAAMSEKMKTRLQEATGIADDKIIVLPQTCEKLYETDVHDERLAKRFKGGFNIMFAGNISPAQSFDTVVEAAKRLHAEGLKDIRWIIVGDGMSRKKLEEDVAAAGLSDNFFFEGMKPMEDIPRYNGVADLLLGCLVKSDLLEATIPAKVMSYIASGKPMVLAMDGEVQDLINKTIKCGYVGPAGDAQALTDNVRKIYKLPAKERQKMGERGRTYHFKHLERSINLNKLYNFIFK